MSAKRSAGAQAFPVASPCRASGSAIRGRTRPLVAVPATSPLVGIWAKTKGQGDAA